MSAFAKSQHCAALTSCERFPSRPTGPPSYSTPYRGKEIRTRRPVPEEVCRDAGAVDALLPLPRRCQLWHGLGQYPRLWVWMPQAKRWVGTPRIRDITTAPIPVSGNGSRAMPSMPASSSSFPMSTAPTFRKGELRHWPRPWHAIRYPSALACSRHLGLGREVVGPFSVVQPL